MKRFTHAAAALALAAVCTAPVLAQSDAMASPNAMASSGAMVGDSMQKDPMVGGAPMYSNKNIVQNAVNSKDHTTLVSLVKKAGLVETLEGPGPFTVFAPTNEAFAKLPKATVEKVTGDKALLTKVLTYHVVAGKLDSAAIAAKIKAGHGKATLKTVEGENLTAKLKGSKLELIDAKGGVSYVTIADVYQSNGVIHVIDTVLIP